MKIVRKMIEAESKGGRPYFHKITDQVKQIVAESGVKEGLCTVYSHHTTCSVVMQECSFDETFTGLEYLQQDLCDIFEEMIPTCRREGQYMHPGPELVKFSREHGEEKDETLNTDGHLRSMFMGRSESIIVMEGEADLGKFGHLYFIDFDQTRGRKRQIQVQVIGE